MNSKDKAAKQSKPPKGTFVCFWILLLNRFILVLPLMTPRNLVPSTPMRFNSTEEAPKKPISQVKGKKTVPLPPGYLDRAAQRRQGIDSSINFEDFHESKAMVEDETKGKLQFLEEINGLNEFPACSNESTERLMNLILKGAAELKEGKSLNDAFRPNEAFLLFKSIEETKTQPFDPFNRPKKVFRATRSKLEEGDFNDDQIIFDRVKEAIVRLKMATERNQKYLEALAATSTETETETEIYTDIFPEAGRFNEKAVLESGIKSKEQTSTKLKAKERLFGSSKKQLPPPPKQEQEIDVFELIAQKSLAETENNCSKEEDTSGGLFGFSGFLPKLSRLDSKDTKKDSSQLSGVYASILSDEENECEDSAVIKREKAAESDEDDYLYPGYLENDPMAFDSDGEAADEPVQPATGKGQKRKLARKEDKAAAKVEKIVKSKFGVDLTK